MIGRWGTPGTLFALVIVSWPEPICSVGSEPVILCPRPW